MEILRSVMTNNPFQRWSKPEVILVATNLLEGPALMLHAVSQAKLSGAKILLVHVIRPAYLRANADHGLPFVLPGPSLRTAQAMLDEIVRQFQCEGVLCEPIVLKGLPEEQIPALIRSRHVDRVLVATRNPRGVERLLERSVAEELMAILDVPVCVIGRQADPPFDLQESRRHRFSLQQLFARAEISAFALHSPGQKRIGHT